MSNITKQSNNSAPVEKKCVANVAYILRKAQTANKNCMKEFKKEVIDLLNNHVRDVDKRLTETENKVKNEITPAAVSKYKFLTIFVLALSVIIITIWAGPDVIAALAKVFIGLKALL